MSCKWGQSAILTHSTGIMAHCLHFATHCFLDWLYQCTSMPVLLYYSSGATSHCMVVEMFGIIIQVMASRSTSVPRLHHTGSCPYPQTFGLQAIFRHPMWKDAISPTDLLHHPLLESPTKRHLYPWGPAYLSHWREHFTSHPHTHAECLV